MARLHVGLLSTAHSKQDILNALEALPKGIDETYDEILNRIKDQPAKEAELAKRVLGWITYAKKPLTIKQLQQALAVTLDSTHPDEDAEPHEQILISACLGIVTVDSKADIIRLVHYTTQEYIEWIRETQFPEAQTVIAKTCLTCLGFNMVTPHSRPVLLDYYIFLRYAIEFWAQHVNDMGKRPDVQEAALRVLIDERKRDAIGSISRSSLVDGTLLHAIAYYGLVTLSLILLSGTPNIPQRYFSRFRIKPLCSHMPDFDIVKYLPDAEKDIEAECSYGRTPLSYAAANGHKEIVKLLLNAKAKVDAQNKDGGTALISAIANSHMEIVEMLLDAKAKVDTQNKDGTTALILAAVHGHEEIVEMLLNAQAKVDAQNKHGDTALIYVAMKGHKEIFEMLLNAQAKVDTQNKDGGTALISATVNGHEEIVEMLLNAKAKVNTQDTFGCTALIYAVMDGHKEIVKMLLNGKAKVDTLDVDGDTALSIAQRYGRTQIVNILLRDMGSITTSR
jgi:ankyrin repeat protein